MILIKQIAIFLGLWFLGELISFYTHLPLSGSIIGMLLLVVGLELKLIKTKDVKDVANFLLNNMAMFFIPAGVGLMCHYRVLKQEWLPISVAIVLSGLLILTVVGLIMKKTILMKELINSPLVHVCLTLIVFILSKKLQQKYKTPLLNPILITIGVVIAFLLITDTSYEDYESNTQIISFWLAPSVIALGYALYSFLEEIKADFKKIILSMLAGSLTGILSVFTIAYLFGASKATMISLAPKSVTTPIAIEVSNQMGGIPSLTVAFVILVGVLGAIFGQAYLKLIGVNDSKSVGLSLGATAHALGTASISEKGPDFSAFGGLGMALNGVITAILAPWVIKLLLLILY